ncbi:MAG: Heparinase family protein, partial [Anaerocolumna sp.]|nr:Heparinase family protein [Anaerocolumna sp.]
RITSSHNTVVVDGQKHTSTEPGIKLNFTKTSCDAKAEHVYEDVDFRRKIELLENGFLDEFEVESKQDRNYDFIFHVESELNMDLSAVCEIEKNSTLGYTENGYSYFEDIIKIKPMDGSTKLILTWKLGELKLASTMDIEDTEVFIAKSPANPVTSFRTSIILRRKAKHTTYQMEWKTV